MGNDLASLETLVDLTARSADDLGEFATSIEARVAAMRHVHGLLSSAGWPAALSTALGIVLQQLTTDSLKHGALGVDAIDGLDGADGRACETAWRDLRGSLELSHGPDHRLSIALSGSSTKPVAATW